MDGSRKDGEQTRGALNTEMSRRTLLKGALGIAGVMLASAFTANAQAKATKAAMKYQDRPKDGQKCSDCRFFMPGTSSTANGTCQVVEGSISPQGWCTAFVKRS